MRIVDSYKGFFPSGRVCRPFNGYVSTLFLKYRHCPRKLTSDMSYLKTHSLVSRAYEDSIAPCVLYTRVRASSSHTDRRLHSLTHHHHQAAAFDNPISSQFSIIDATACEDKWMIFIPV